MSGLSAGNHEFVVIGRAENDSPLVGPWQPFTVQIGANGNGLDSLGRLWESTQDIEQEDPPQTVHVYAITGIPDDPDLGHVARATLVCWDPPKKWAMVVQYEPIGSGHVSSYNGSYN